MLKYGLIHCWAWSSPLSLWHCTWTTSGVTPDIDGLNPIIGAQEVRSVVIMELLVRMGEDLS